MSAELIVWDLVRRPSFRLSSVYVFDYLLTCCMDFFPLLVVASPGPYPRTSFDFLKKKVVFFFNFLRIYFFFVNLGPMAVTILKAAESFQTFPEFSLQWSSQNYLRIFGILTFFSFLLIWDPMGAQKFQNATPTNCSRKF